MTQPSFFDTPRSPAPSRGRTERSQEASRSGARVQTVHCWTAKQSQLLQLLTGGPKCRQELAGLTGLGINAVCSLLDSLIKQGVVVSNGDYDFANFNGRITKRERFRVRGTP